MNLNLLLSESATDIVNFQNQQFKRAVKSLIITQYKSISSFCKVEDFDKGDLSKFLNNKKDWGFIKVLKLLQILDTDVHIRPHKSIQYIGLTLENKAKRNKQNANKAIQDYRKYWTMEERLFKVNK